MHFRVFYLLRHELFAPLQTAYDAAVAILKTSIDGARTKVRQGLIDATGKFNSDGFLSPTVIEKLADLDEAERLAHAWAAYYMFAIFAALEPEILTDRRLQTSILGNDNECTTDKTGSDHTERRH